MHHFTFLWSPSPVILISLVWVGGQEFLGLWFKASVKNLGYLYQVWYPLSKLVRGVLENHSPRTQHKLLTLLLAAHQNLIVKPGCWK